MNNMKETKYLVELIQVGLNKKIVLHTNFIITPSFINNIDGINNFSIQGKYECIIAKGKLFSWRKLLKNIAIAVREKDSPIGIIDVSKIKDHPHYK
tara:strand:+ start:1788 stop:2075 length:288 start_codon:yes stop_codon:yes gene_type:complete